MKRFTKVCLVLGILLLVSGAALGGVSYGLGVEKDIRSAMNPPAPEMEEITIPGAELGRLEIGLISDDVTVEASKDGDAHIRAPWRWEILSSRIGMRFRRKRGRSGARTSASSRRRPWSGRGRSGFRSPCFGRTAPT